MTASCDDYLTTVRSTTVSSDVSSSRCDFRRDVSADVVDVEPTSDSYVCSGQRQRSETGHSVVIQHMQRDNDVRDVGTAADAAAAADDDDDDNDDDDDTDTDFDDVCMDGACSRPDRPDCVPTIDLSWTTDDERDVTRPLCHVTPMCRRNQLRNETTAAAQSCADHVIQDGGRPEVAVKRRQKRRRRAICKRKHYYVTSVVRSTCTLPLTPQTPRQQIVRPLDIPETENDAMEERVQLERTGSAQANNDCVLSGHCVSGSENNFRCKTTTNRHDVISARDVTVNNASNADIDMSANADIDMSASFTASSATTMKAADLSADVTICQTGSSNVNVNAEGFHDCLGPPNLMSMQRCSDTNEILRRDGGDAVCVDEKMERESSPSLVERLLCVLDCCHCCRLTMSSYPSPPEQ